MTFMKTFTETVELVAGTLPTNETKKSLLFGQKFTSGDLFVAQSGYPQPNYYVPLELPTFADGTSALNYMKKLGFQVNLGFGFDLALPTPDAIIPQGALTIVQWNSVPTNFTQLTGFDLSGTLSQLLVNADVKLAQIITVSMTQKAQLIVYGTPAFTTSNPMGLTGVNNVVYPDPITTDPICCMVWDFYQTALSAPNSALGSPTALISVVSDRDPSITPVATPIALVDPVTALSVSGVTQLTYPTSAANLGYLPTTAWGATTVTQAVSNATGTYGGYTIDGSTVTIYVTDVTGSFDLTNTISIVLDNTINGGSEVYLNNINLNSAVLQYPIVDETSVTSTHADFYAVVDRLNTGNNVLQKNYGTFGIAGNVTSSPANAANLPDINNSNDIFVTYPYYPKFGNIPYENSTNNVAAGRFASAVAYMLANQDAPFPALTDALITHLPVATNWQTTSYSASAGGTGDQAVDEGWLPMAPNSLGQVRFLQSVTSLTTIPNTNIIDNEFRYTHVWQCVRVIKRAIAQLFVTCSTLPDNQGTAILSPAFLEQFKSGIMNALNFLQNQQVIQNLALYKDLITVTIDLTDPTQVDVYVPAQIIPQLNGGSALIKIFSASITNFNTNQ